MFVMDSRAVCNHVLLIMLCSRVNTRIMAET